MFADKTVTGEMTFKLAVTLLATWGVRVRVRVWGVYINKMQTYH